MLEKKNIRNLSCKCASLAISFLATMIITRIVVLQIGNETYGFYSLSVDFINYALIISVALNSMSSRFISISYYANQISNVNKYFNSIFYANVGLAIILLGPIILVIWKLERILNIPKELIYDVKILFVYMSLNFLITIVSSVFSVSTFLKNRVDLDSIRATESYLLRVMVVFICFKIFEPRIWYVGIACLVSSIYVFAINIYYVKKMTPEIRLLDTSFISFRHAKEVISSGAWNCLTRIGSVLLSGVDLLLANISVSTAGMGVLSVSKTLPKLIISAISNFATAFTPKITITYVNNSKGELVQNIFSAIKICGFFSIIIQSVVIVLGREIYILWVPNQNSWELYILSVVAMLGYIILMPLENLYNVFTITNKVKKSSIYLFIESLITIGIVIFSTLLTNNDFIKLLIIAGTSSIAETIRGLIFLPIYSATCLEISKFTFYRPLRRVLFANLFTIIISFSICKLLINITWGWLVVKGLLIGVVSLVCWWLIVISKDEKKVIISLLKGNCHVT